jgi:dipeptidyl aminopeptidase/acylaminoacyl peptidase
VRPGDKLADRKPYVAFYAGAEYTEIPMDNYDATMDYLTRNDVRFLSLYYPVIDAVRPVLSPLLTDPAVILGELRYKQVYAREEGLFIYERTGQQNPLRWTRLTDPDVGRVASPAWSPDGKRIAFVKKGERDGGILWVPSDGSALPRELFDGPANDGHPAWSHDGTRLAFASTLSGNWDVYVCTLATHRAVQVTSNPEADGAPSWFPGDRDLAFVSSHGNRTDLWKLNLETGELTQLTHTGGNTSRSCHRRETASRG